MKSPKDEIEMKKSIIRLTVMLVIISVMGWAVTSTTQPKSSPFDCTEQEE